MKNSLFKKIGAFFMVLCVMMTSGIFSVTHAKNIKMSKSQLIIDGKNTKKQVNYFNESGKVYVSLNDIFVFTGGTYDFDGKNAVAKKGKDIIKVANNSKNAYVNGTKVALTTLPKVIDKKLYVPVDFLGEAIDGKISFNLSNKTLNIRRKMPLLYTDSFSVTYLKGGIKKVVDGDKRTLILVPKGKAVPAEYKNNIVINIPIDNVMLASTTQGCLLRPLGVISSVKCVTTNVDQWTISEVAEGMKAGKIQFVGNNTAPDYEKISTLKPSIAFVYSGSYGLQPVMSKFDELKIKYAVDNEYLEENPLGRMEWIKFVAAFYNKEDIAEKYFNQVVNTANQVVKSVSKEKKTKIVWGMIYKGQVYVPKADSYVSKMIEMAGAENLIKISGTGSGQISLEEFYSKAKEADVMIYSSLNQYTPTLEAVIEQAPTLANTNVVKNKKVWCFNPDYYQSLDKTDELIKDLAAIFHPNIYQGYKVKHYIKYTK